MNWLPTPWPQARLRHLFRLRQDRPSDAAEIVTAFRDGQVVCRAARRLDGFTEAIAEVGYQQVHQGDLVIHAMDAFAGAIGVSQASGKCSPVCQVLIPLSHVDPRFVAYTLREGARSGYIQSLARGIRERSTDFRWRQAKDVVVPNPELTIQISTANFLDRESERFEALLAELDASSAHLMQPAVARFAELTDAIPRGRISYRFDVQLGKMLDSKRIDEAQTSPYLRNTNVQWDAIHLDDLNAMTFTRADRRKFELKTGDLLVCEGGQPGRSAVWQGQLANCYFQKALIRVRPRRADSTRFLMWALRLASERGDFAAEGTGSTILHLPAERLAATRVPFCSPAAQRAVVEEVDELARRGRQVQVEMTALRRSLAEYRAALVAEAVTGRLNVSRLTEAQMAESLDAVRQGESPEVLAK